MASNHVAIATKANWINNRSYSIVPLDWNKN